MRWSTVKDDATEGTTATTGAPHKKPGDADKQIAQSAPETSVAARLTHLQRTAGNTAVLRMLGKPTAPRNKAPETPDTALQDLPPRETVTYNG
ncbi:hypothetical protein ABT001_22510 [Streptomyces sp. NPDC002793]|uniref:hypothetical protein n=1 Tax=Streptomyces sp. NPDC002793 TaxID=3154432 RepID=UPI003316E8FB